MKLLYSFILSIFVFAASAQQTVNIAFDGCDVNVVKDADTTVSQTFNAAQLTWDTLFAADSAFILRDDSRSQWFYMSNVSNYDSTSVLFAALQVRKDSCSTVVIPVPYRFTSTVRMDSLPIWPDTAGRAPNTLYVDTVGSSGGLKSVGIY